MELGAKNIHLCPEFTSAAGDPLALLLGCSPRPAPPSRGGRACVLRGECQVVVAMRETCQVSLPRRLKLRGLGRKSCAISLGLAAQAPGRTASPSGRAHLCPWQQCWHRPGWTRSGSLCCCAVCDRLCGLWKWQLGTASARVWLHLGVSRAVRRRGTDAHGSCWAGPGRLPFLSCLAGRSTFTAVPAALVPELPATTGAFVLGCLLSTLCSLKTRMRKYSGGF